MLYRHDDWAPRVIVSEGVLGSGQRRVDHPCVDTDDPRIVRWMQTHGLDAAQYSWRVVETTLA